MTEKNVNPVEILGSEPEQGLRTVRDHGPDLPIGGTGPDWRDTAKSYISRRT